MARTKQDWYQGLREKKSKALLKKALDFPMGYYSMICEQRNHKLISLSGHEDGSGKIVKGQITFYCNTCETEITTTVNAYRATKITGCRSCKQIQVKSREAEKRFKKPREKVYKKTSSNLDKS